MLAPLLPQHTTDSMRGHSFWEEPLEKAALPSPCFPQLQLVPLSHLGVLGDAPIHILPESDFWDALVGSSCELKRKGSPFCFSTSQEDVFIGRPGPILQKGWSQLCSLGAVAKAVPSFWKHWG